MFSRRPWLGLGRALARGALVAAALIALSSCASLPVLHSAWRDTRIAIDGADQEWEGARYYLEESNLDIAVRNDGDYLYLCLIAVDRAVVMQVLGQGMTTWLNPQGNRDKAFGVRYPLGRGGAPQGGRPGMGAPEGMEAAAAGRRPAGRYPGAAQGGAMDPQQLQAFAARALSGQELEIVYDGAEEGRRVGLTESGVVEARMAYERGRLIYELKVRLAQIEPHGPGIGAAPGGRVGVGLLTPERATGPGGRARGGLGGGMGGAGVPGAGLRPGAGMRPGMMPAGGTLAEPLAAWFRVELASPGGTATVTPAPDRAD